MSYSCTAFNVMIATPSDLHIERGLIREQIQKWNSLHSYKQKCVLLPIGWDTHSIPLLGDRPQGLINKQVLAFSDLLIASFWTRFGTPTGEADSGTAEEIDEHLAAGKPTIVCFSQSPVALESVDLDQYSAVKAYRQSLIDSKRGLMRDYSSPAEFADAVFCDLTRLLNTHPYFLDRLPPPEEVSQSVELAEELNGGVRYIPGILTRDITSEAKQLLIAAASSDGQVAMVNVLAGLIVQAAGRNFVESNDARSEAIWRGAVTELVDLSLLEPIGTKGQVFAVTRKGYEVADLLK